MKVLLAFVVVVFSEALLLNPPHQRVIAGRRRCTASSEAPPPRSFFKWYDAQLQRAPLRTKMASSGLVSIIGDCAAQLLTTQAYSVRRGITWALVGCLYFAPFLHFYYGKLASFEAKALARGVSKRTAVIFELLLNQTFGAMTVNALFFFVFAFVSACVALVVDATPLAPVALVHTAAATLREKFAFIMFANWAIWPLPSLVNLVFVPLQYRVLFTNTVALLWKCVLSILTNTPTR